MNVPSPLSVERAAGQGDLVPTSAALPLTDNVSRVSPSGSVSLARTLPVVKLVSSSVAKPTSARGRGSVVGPVMVIVTVAVSVPPLPSVTV